MYTLIIGKSKSASFKKAIDLAKVLGGEFDGEKITITIREDMKAYQILFPLFRLNVLEWKNTRAYHNGNKVNPYRFMLKMEKKRETFYAQVLEQLDSTTLSSLLNKNTTDPYLYHKRDGNTFYFQGPNHAFNLNLSGKMLYDFVDKYDIGDIVYFE